MLNYAQFYTRNGVRHPSQLTSPPVRSLGMLYLPINSVYHYISNDEEEIGAGPDDPVLQLVKSGIIVEHVTDLPEDAKRGRITKLALQTNSLISQYHQRNAKYRKMSNGAGALKDPRMLWVISYNLLYRHYRYADTVTVSYDRWANNLLTVVEKINSIADRNNPVSLSTPSTSTAVVANPEMSMREKAAFARADKNSQALTNSTDRQQYIIVDIPNVLPPIQYLSQGTASIDSTFLKRFHTDNAKMVMALWEWLGKDRAQSALGKLTDKAAQQLNLILRFKGSWTVVSLATLNSWRVSEGDAKPKPGQVSPDIIQRRFLRLLMSVVESATVASEEVDDIQIRLNEQKQTVGRSDDGALGLTNKKAPAQSVPAAKEAATTTTNTGTSKRPSLAEIINGGLADRVSSAPETKDDSPDAGSDDTEFNDAEMEKDLAALLAIAELDESETEAVSTYKAYVPPSDDLSAGVTAVADDLARKGLLSAAEHRRFTKLASRYKEIPNPFGNGTGTLEEFARIDPAILKVGESTPLMESVAGVADKSMLSSSIKDLDDRYIKTVLNKDIANVCMQLQRSGVIIQDYKVAHVEDYNDSFDVHTISLLPVRGKASTVRFQVPRVKEDATFKAGGVINHMRKQRGDIPIRKTAPDTVALTSYYSKMFVTRSERAVSNYGRWLINKIISIGIDKDDGRITDMRMGDAFNNDLRMPRPYGAVSTKVTGFTAGEYEYCFDYRDIPTFFSQPVLEFLSSKEISPLALTPIAKSKDSILVMRGDAGIVYKLSTTDSGLPNESMGDIEDVLGIPSNSRPLDIAEVAIFGKDIPVGFLLAQQLGLGNLLETLKPTFRRAAKGSSYKLTSDEYAIKFEDETLILNRREVVNTLIFAGLNRYHKDIKRYSVYSFDKKDVFANVLEANGIGVRWAREFDLLFRQWVDPITRDILVSMNEPTDMFGLFVASAKLLTHDQHPREMDQAFMRDKGYERIAGMVYFELIKALRGYNSRPAAANAAVDVNPMAVWMSMLQDQTVRPIDQSNPIQAMKDKEVVIYSGAGGRSGQTMVATSRTFDKNSMGITSEATVDSGDVGTITYLTADPNYDSLRGTTRRIKETKGNAAKLVSTSWLLAPGADTDDPKRINFTSVQNSQTTYCKGARPMPVRTGYERMMAHRSDELYAKVAADKGVVTAVSDVAVSVQYENGDVASFPLGRRFGAWGGVCLPHDIQCDLKAGDKLDKGDVILYNTKYFVRDILDPKQVIFKLSTLGRVVFWEAVDTLEDSCAIDDTLADQLTTQGTEIRYVTVKFDEEVRNLIKVGESVKPETILCTIHPATLGGSDLFDDAALTTLQTLSTNAPAAKVTGVVDKIEVLYTGDMEDMAASLRKLAEKSDFDLHKYRKQMRERTVDGRIEPGFRAGGTEVGMDTVVIKIYITGDIAMDVGDKLVVSSQMKSIVGRRLSGVQETEDGVPFNCIFSYDGLVRRIVNSAESIGTTTTLLLHIGNLAVAAYEKES